MRSDKISAGFGLVHIRGEGMPAHPEDIYIHCGCAKCEARWQKQLKAYNDAFEGRCSTTGVESKGIPSAG
jgi:hypothetical protein